MSDTKEYYVHVVFQLPSGSIPQPGEVGFPAAPPSWGDDRRVPVPVNKDYVYIGQLTDAEVEQVNGAGMFAVVESPQTGMTLVFARKADVLDFSEYRGSYKSIVQMVDLTPYEERKAKIAKRVALKKHIERLAEEARAALDLSALLGDNPEAQALIAELKSLS